MARTTGPTALVLSRQNLPVLDRSAAGPGSPDRGAYVIADAPRVDTPIDAIIIATGSEVILAMEARALLERQGISVRVVSMPCWERFREETATYRESVLPPAITARVSVEAGVTFGWETWIGLQGVAVGLDRFGASAPGEVLMSELGFTADHVIAAVHRALGR